MFYLNYDYNNGRIHQSGRREAAMLVRDNNRGMQRRAFNDTSSAGLFGAGGSGHQLYSPPYERAEDPTVAEQYLPTDTQTQNRIFRNIALTDPIAGPAISFYQDMAFGTKVLLGGIEDDTIRKFYEDAIEASNIEAEMPWLLNNYLIFGRVVASQHMDGSKGYWTTTDIHDPDFIKIHLSPFSSDAPIIDAQPNNDFQEWATMEDPRAAAQREKYDPEYIQMLATGDPYPLAPENTIFMARRAYASDRYGSSLLTRILPYKIYEKAIMDSSVTAARRRTGPVWIVNVPENYEAGEIREVIDQLFAAEEDPVAAKVALREGVTVTPLGGGGSGEFWTITQEFDFLKTAKSTALGVSDTFLSGDATYNSMDKVLHVFLEKMRAVRRLFTQEVIVKHMLRTLAREHGYVKTKTAHYAHHYRVAKKHISDADLLIPSVEWDKPLEPSADLDYFDMLERLEGKGIIISWKKYAQAAGYDLAETTENQQSEIELRGEMYEFRRALIEQAEEYGFSAEGDFLGEGGDFGGGFGGGGGLSDLGGGGGGLGDLGGDLGTPSGGPPETLELGPAAGGGAGGGEAGGGGGGGLPAPAGPLEGGGAGAAPDKPRFRIPEPLKHLRTATPHYKDLEEALTMIPVWNEANQAFGVPRRRVAKFIDMVAHMEPKRRKPRRLGYTFRKAGLNTLQVDVVQYLTARLGFIPPPPIGAESLRHMQEFLVDQADQYGLTSSLSREMEALARMYQKRDRGSSTGFGNLVSREAGIPDAQLLTGVLPGT